MKIAIGVVGLFLGMATTDASAQTVPSDVRCLLLSNAFTKSTDVKAHEGAAQSLSYFIGRLEGRISDQVLVNTMRAQIPTLDPKTASAEMAACATRLMRAQQRVQALGQSLRPAR